MSSEETFVHGRQALETLLREKLPRSNYVIRRTDKEFHERYSIEDAIASGELALHWYQTHPILKVKIPFDGTPFACLGRQQLDFQFGEERGHSMSSSSNDEKLFSGKEVDSSKQHIDHSYAQPAQVMKDRLKIQGTRKMGCKAKYFVRRVVRFPDFAIEESCGSRYQRMKAMAMLKDQLTKIHPISDMKIVERQGFLRRVVGRFTYY